MNDEWKSARRLADDPAYWDALAARSIEAALGGTRRPAAAGSAWWRALANAAWPLAACAVLALLAGATLYDERPGTAPRTDLIADALAPDDALLRSLLDAPAAPPAGTLLRLVALRAQNTGTGPVPNARQR